MSVPSQIGSPVKSDTVLNERIDRLFNQNNILEDIEHDWRQVIDRLRNLGLRLNSTSHPDNVPQESDNKLSSGTCESIMPADGILGRIDSAIEGRQNIINRFNNSIIKELQKNLSYLEQHI